MLGGCFRNTTDESKAPEAIDKPTQPAGGKGVTVEQKKAPAPGSVVTELWLASQTRKAQIEKLTKQLQRAKRNPTKHSQLIKDLEAQIANSMALDNQMAQVFKQSQIVKEPETKVGAFYDLLARQQGGCRPAELKAVLKAETELPELIISVIADYCKAQIEDIMDAAVEQLLKYSKTWPAAGHSYVLNYEHEIRKALGGVLPPVNPKLKDCDWVVHAWRDQEERVPLSIRYFEEMYYFRAKMAHWMFPVNFVGRLTSGKYLAYREPYPIAGCGGVATNPPEVLLADSIDEILEGMTGEDLYDFATQSTTNWLDGAMSSKDANYDVWGIRDVKGRPKGHCCGPPTPLLLPYYAGGEKANELVRW